MFQAFGTLPRLVCSVSIENLSNTVPMTDLTLSAIMRNEFRQIAPCSNQVSVAVLLPKSSSTHKMLIDVTNNNYDHHDHHQNRWSRESEENVLGSGDLLIVLTMLGHHRPVAISDVNITQS